MYKLHTEKQLRYFDEVIRLHYQEGMGEEKISRIIPVGHSTVSRWIAIFARENKISTALMRKKPSNPNQPSPARDPQDVESLQSRIRELEAQLRHESLRADFYDEMINVAEAKFNIPIRKNAGAKR